MKTLVLYYSLGGHSKAHAQKRAEELGADLREIRPVKPVGRFRAILLVPRAEKGVAIEPLQDLDAYERVELFAPVWAGKPAAPAVAALHLLPAGKAVAVTLSSGGGKADCEAWLRGHVEARGCALESVIDVQG